MMVDQFHWPMAPAQFTAIILRVMTFVCDAPKIFSHALPDTVLAHIGSGSFSYGLPVVLPICQVQDARARLAAVVSSAGSRVIDVKIFKRQFLFTAITALRRSWFVSFGYAHTLSGAGFSFMGMRPRDHEFGAANSAWFRNGIKVPSLLAFLKLVFFKVPDSHSCLVYSR